MPPVQSQTLAQHRIVRRARLPAVSSDLGDWWKYWTAVQWV